MTAKRTAGLQLRGFAGMLRGRVCWPAAPVPGPGRLLVFLTVTEDGARCQELSACAGLVVLSVACGPSRPGDLDDAVAVADELNFGRAAARLYLSQPALSRQISSLERLVGCELLRRSTHRVELTLAGEALLGRVRELLQSLDEAVSVTRSLGGALLARVNRHWELAGLGSEVTDPRQDLQELRDAFEALHAQFEPPPGVSVRPVNAAGVAALLNSPGPEEPAWKSSGVRCGLGVTRCGPSTR